MMKKWLWLVSFTLLLVLAACSSESTDEQSAEEPAAEESTTEEATIEAPEGGFPQLTADVAENEALVTMKTSMGDMKIKLFPEYAPKTVENFLTHSKDGYYDGLKFHRVIQEFMIQGGDPEGTGRGGESIYGEPFEDEITPYAYNLRGALSMANSGPNTNGSQFFIVQSTALDESLQDQIEASNYPDEIKDAYIENGGTPWLDGNHTVFGQVIEGLDVLDAIATVETEAGDVPAEDIIIESIEVEQEPAE